MANGRTGLDREGCEFGRGLAREFGTLKEDVGEVKQDVKKLIISVARIEQAVQSKPNSKQGGGSKEFWASMVALATALTAVALALAKVG